VLSSGDDLLEVGADGTAIAAPGASAVEQTAAMLERGVALPAQSVAQTKALSSCRPVGDRQEFLKTR